MEIGYRCFYMVQYGLKVIEFSSEPYRSFAATVAQF